ncbi:MAG: cob(I)yrinic acid a,c-diamide adenosyltransferase [Magnetococcales bacterium]|nr:cob(I)yrinic acid a,c-diamide adenosyltransferase [Magnetococcales bacterium]
MADRDTVVLVHGLWTNGWDMRLLQARLAAQGFRVRLFRNRTVTRTVAENAARLHAFLAEQAPEGAHLVGHSLGGLVVLRHLQDHPGDRVGLRLAIAAPFQGSLAARRLAAWRGSRWLLGHSYPQGLDGQGPRAVPAGVRFAVVVGRFPFSLARLVTPDLPSPNDGVVAEVETLLTGEVPRQVIRGHHMGMLFSRHLATLVGDRLRRASLDPPPGHERPPMSDAEKKRGLTLVLTGDGKGKSSSAFGMVLRAAGWNMRICVIQFVKGKWQTGEERAAARLGTIEWHALGDGFTWNTQNPEQDRATSRTIWSLCQERVRSGNFDMVVWDEINFAVGMGWLTGAEVADFIRQEKPPALHLILTGRNASPELVAVADTVTEMVEVKHAFQAGIKATRGIEF